MIVEIEKPQDLQSEWVYCRPRKAIGVNSSPERSRLRKQEEPVFQFTSKGGIRPMSWLKAVKQSGGAFCSIQTLN